MTDRLLTYYAQLKGVGTVAKLIVAWLVATGGGTLAAIGESGSFTPHQAILPAIVSALLLLLLGIINAFVKLYTVRTAAQTTREAGQRTETANLVEAFAQLQREQRDGFFNALREMRGHFEMREAAIRDDRHHVGGLAQAYHARLLNLRDQGTITAAQATVLYLDEVIPKLAQPGGEQSYLNSTIPPQPTQQSNKA